MTPLMPIAPQLTAPTGKVALESDADETSTVDTPSFAAFLSDNDKSQTPPKLQLDDLVAAQDGSTLVSDEKVIAQDDGDDVSEDLPMVAAPVSSQPYTKGVIKTDGSLLLPTVSSSVKAVPLSDLDTVTLPKPGIQAETAQAPFSPKKADATADQADLQLAGNKVQNIVFLKTPHPMAPPEPQDKVMSPLERAIAQTHSETKATAALVSADAKTLPVEPIKSDARFLPPQTPVPDAPKTSLEPERAPLKPNSSSMVGQTPPEVSAASKAYPREMLNQTTSALSKSQGLAAHGQETRLTKSEWTLAARALPNGQGIGHGVTTLLEKNLAQLNGGEFEARLEAATLPVEKSPIQAPHIQSTQVTNSAAAAEHARQIAHQLANATPSQAPGTTEITLNPEELGRVRMSLSIQDGAMTLTIMAERAETADLMRRHIDQLAQTYRQLGFTNMAFNFEGAQNGQSSQTGLADSDEMQIVEDVLIPDIATTHTVGLNHGRLDHRF